MASQADINEKMRAILIDWLVEVSQKFKLLPETFYIAINLIDRYIGVSQVHRAKL
jgi:cyclin B